MSLKIRARKFARLLKLRGYKLRLPIRAALAKLHVRGKLYEDALLKMGASYLGEGGCTCCMTTQVFDLHGVEIEIWAGRLYDAAARSNF